MPSLFADTEATVEIEFDGGELVTLRKFIDAGTQEDLENSMIRYKVKNQRGKKQEREEYTDAELRMGSLDLIQRMVIQIDYPNGRTDKAPVPMSTLRKLDNAAYNLLKETIEENNPPLEETDLTPQMPMMESPEEM